MTKLDEFIPEGTPMHPYDLFELIKKETIMPTTWHSAPPAVDEADYQRNKHKVGNCHVIGGKKYFETTSVAAKTRLTA